LGLLGDISINFQRDGLLGGSDNRASKGAAFGVLGIARAFYAWASSEIGNGYRRVTNFGIGIAGVWATDIEE
jgi:hypothetical protein